MLHVKVKTPGVRGKKQLPTFVDTLLDIPLFSIALLYLVFILQVMLTEGPVPAVSRLRLAADTYQQQHAACYYADLLRAHAAVGLLRQVSIRDNSRSPSAAANHQEPLHTAWGFAALVPYKDMEVCIVGKHLCCPAFQKMLHAALRAVIDGLGCRMYNVGALNLDLAAEAPAGVGLERQYWSSSSSGRESSSNGASKGIPDLPHSLSIADAANSDSDTAGSGGIRITYTTEDIHIPDVLGYDGRSPVIARIVSRGKLSAATLVTSDFGGLEVFGGASIGHTDPFLVVQQLDMQLSGQSVLPFSRSDVN